MIRLRARTLRRLQMRHQPAARRVIGRVPGGSTRPTERFQPPVDEQLLAAALAQPICLGRTHSDSAHCTSCGRLVRRRGDGQLFRHRTEMVNGLDDPFAPYCTGGAT